MQPRRCQAAMLGDGGEGGLGAVGANAPRQGQRAHSWVWARLRGSNGGDSPALGGCGLCRRQRQQGLGLGWQQPDLWNN